MKFTFRFIALGLLVVALGVIAGTAFAETAPPSPASGKLERANQLAQDKGQPVLAVVAAFADAIEANPESLPAHQALRKFRNQVVYRVYQQKETKPDADAVNKAIEDNYTAWEKKYPDSVGINYAIGERLEGAEDPRAKPYLLKVVALDPKNAAAWAMLWGDAERWGDQKGASEYMLKASQAEPNNPAYAFYYAHGLKHISAERWEAASLDVARRFPQDDRGAQSLYWLGAGLKEDSRKIEIWERARREFPVAKFSWTKSSVDGLYNVYLRTAPEKAVAFAKEMVALGGEDAKRWASSVEFAELFAQVKQLADAGNFGEANALIDKMAVDRRSPNPNMTLLLKAQVIAGAGKQREAYDLLLKQYAQSPDDELRAGLARVGAPLSKDAKAISADTWKLRDAAAKPAPGFDLGLYTSDKSVSLESLKGKVVFVTFWFPGCGPCRGEFPHFENVVRKFKDRADLVYLGINGIRQQDAYVLPFMEGTKYSFIPLKGEKTVTNPDAYNVKYYPTNFLIDRDGRIVFSGFRTDSEQDELVLQRMIESLLVRPARS